MANAFDKLNEMLDTKIAEGKVVGAQEVKSMLTSARAEAENQFNESLTRLATLSTTATKLGLQHMHQFNEVLDPDDLFSKAQEAKATDIEHFYRNSYAVDKFTAKQQAEAERAQQELDAKLAAAREEGRRTALAEKVGETGVGPTMDGASEMGHFQSRLMNPRPAAAANADGTPKAPGLDNAELGRGIIARNAALAGDRAEMESRVA